MFNAPSYFQANAKSMGGMAIALGAMFLVSGTVAAQNSSLFHKPNVRVAQAGNVGLVRFYLRLLLTMQPGSLEAMDRR